MSNTESQKQKLISKFKEFMHDKSAELSGQICIDEIDRTIAVFDQWYISNGEPGLSVLENYKIFKNLNY